VPLTTKISFVDLVFLFTVLPTRALKQPAFLKNCDFEQVGQRLKFVV